MNSKDYIPTKEECYRLFHEYSMYDNIIAHSKQVTRIALALVDSMKEPTAVNRDLVEASALLHDITKTRSIETGEKRHDKTGEELLRSLGMERVARIVGDHVRMKDFNETGPLEEREIVFYADKRVRHDVIVSLDERIDDLVERYGINPLARKKIKEGRRFGKKLEAKIARHLSRPLEDIIGEL